MSHANDVAEVTMDGAESSNVSRVRLQRRFQVYAVYADNADDRVEFVCFDEHHARRMGARHFDVTPDEIEARYCRDLVIEDAY